MGPAHLQCGSGEIRQHRPDLEHSFQAESCPVDISIVFTAAESKVTQICVLKLSSNTGWEKKILPKT